MNPEEARTSERNTDNLHKKREDIEKQWTRLLLDWVKVCGHAHTTLAKVDFMDVVRMYGEDLFVECQPLPEALGRFLETRFPKLDIKLSDLSDSSRNLYIVATVLLYHCITNGPVNAVINICLYLSLEQQTLVQKFCEQLKDVDVTVSTVDAAIAGAFESTSEILEPDEELHNRAAYNPIETTKINNDISKSLNTSDSSDTEQTKLIECNPAQTIDTLFLKSPFVVKSSAIGYPGKIISKAKNITDASLSTTVGFDNPMVNKSDEISTKVSNTQKAGKADESKVQVTPEFFNELDVEPTKLEASDLNLPFFKTCTVNKSKQDMRNIHIIHKSLINSDMTVTTPVNNAPLENFDTLFLKCPFPVKSSAFEYPRNSQSEIISTTDVTLLSTVDSKLTVKNHEEQEKIAETDDGKIQSCSESLNNPDIKVIKPESRNFNAASNNLHIAGKDEDKVKNYKSTNKDHIESLKNHNPVPITVDRTENIKTLYLQSPFSIKSSAFGYAGKTGSVRKKTFSVKCESRNTAKICPDVTSRKQCTSKNEEKVAKINDKKISNTVAPTMTKTDLKSKQIEGIDQNAKLHVIEDEEEKEEKEKSLKTEPSKHSLDPEQLITEDTTEAIETVYLKSHFSIKSSAFGYLDKAMSDTKNVTNMSVLTTAETTKNGDIIKKKTNNKTNNIPASLNNGDLELKIRKSSFESTRGKEDIAENEDKATNDDQGYDISLCRGSEKPVNCVPVGNIDTLFMKFPFTVKSSAFGYLNKIRAKKKIVTEKITTNINGNSLETTKKIVVEEKINNERTEGSKIQSSVDNLNVNHEPNKPSSALVVAVADTESSKSPFTFKSSAMKHPNRSVSWKKNVTIRDPTVYVDSRHYVTNVISEVSPQFNVLKDPVDETKSGSKMEITKGTDETKCPCPVCACKENAGNSDGSCRCLKSRTKSKNVSDQFRFSLEKPKKFQEGFNVYGIMSNKKIGITLIIALAIIITLAILTPFLMYAKGDKTPNKLPDVDVTVRRYKLMAKEEKKNLLINMNLNPNNKWFSWECKNGLCQKVYQPHMTGPYKSLSRCTLLCTGPQLWPHPIGHKFFGNKIVALGRKHFSYKVPSQAVHDYLNEAYNLFLRDLLKLEIMEPKAKQPLDLAVKDLHIEFDIESDPDPRIRLDTEESYILTMETTDVVKVKIKSPSFCGVRHGLETLSQIILLDQRTGYLITLIHARIKDAPSYKYRGLMIDTARNYIPVRDLLRTIDAMAMCKLNTFHWRISDAASFPMVIPDFPQLFEYGAYDRGMVYTAQDIKFLVERAGFRGIRILIEVAAPGPVGRAWSWTTDAYSPPTKGKSSSTSDVLCLRLKMHESTFDVLEAIYTFIIKMTKVQDIFHLSNGLFSFVNCFGLVEDREHFLDRALVRLRIANNGSLPRLPLIWYNANLMSRSGWVWHNLGIQLHEEDLPEIVLSKFRLIQSSRWDLSCEMNKHRCVRYGTWQQMYNWKTWRDLDVMTIEGGEAVLWTDLVDTNNLDTHLWPRTAAVAERLWSDAMANQSASTYEYLRMDAQRWRMLIRGVKVQTVWPLWCSFNPGQCFAKIK